jgi:uncharacterized membrane protein YoaK (UPF0700 family)
MASPRTDAGTVTNHRRRGPTRATVRDLLLMGLTVSSGAVDAISFIALGKVFTAFMTGNLVFLGLGAADAFGPGGPDVPRVAAALVAFSAGVFLSTRVVNASKQADLWPRGVSLALAGVVVAQTGFLSGWVVVSGHPSTGFATWLAAIAALAMGLQSGAVLSLGVTGVFTTAATATIMFLTRDAARPASLAEPARLAGVLISLVAGATAGGLLLVHAQTYAPALPPVLTLLVVAAASLTLARRSAVDGEPRA